jgi:hypothetical protein
MTKQNKELLQSLYMKYMKAKYPSVPEHGIPIEKWGDGSANDLTKTIIKFLTYIGCQAERINNTGIYRDGKKTVTDVIGRKRVIGSGKWTKGTGTQGTADISATVLGRSVKIEVKHGKDRQSQAQKDYESSVTRAGGKYFLAKDFDNFINEFRVWYRQNL